MTATKPHPKCWANSLGACSVKLSREHLISASVFPNSKGITVFGFPWCREKPITVGLSSLTSKVLCLSHNSLLSVLDTEAGNVYRTFNEMSELVNKRASLNEQKFKVRHYRFNGPLIERWLLKTLINLCYDDKLFIGSESTLPGRPDDRHVRICFNKDRFSGHAGLYVAAKVGGSFASGPALNFSPLIADGTHVLGGFFNFRGLLLFLSLMDEQLPQDFNWVDGLNSLDWKGTAPSWHFKKLVIKANGGRSHVVHFDWGSK